MTNKIDNFFGQYRFLSNFYPCEVIYNGIEFPSVQHAYQAQKTSNVSIQLRISHLDSPGKAKRQGAGLKIRSDWEDIKYQIMRDLVRKKFINNSDLATMLINTNDVELIQGNTWGDVYWGVCKGKGLNKLGIILMEIRNQLQQIEKVKRVV